MHVFYQEYYIKLASPWSVGLGEGSPYKASQEEIGSLADVCNQKKKAAKIVGVRSKAIAYFWYCCTLFDDHRIRVLTCSLPCS